MADKTSSPFILFPISFVSFSRLFVRYRLNDHLIIHYRTNDLLVDLKLALNLKHMHKQRVLGSIYKYVNYL